MVNMLFIEQQSETAFKETHKNPINGQNTKQINLGLPGSRFCFIFQYDCDFEPFLYSLLTICLHLAHTWVEGLERVRGTETSANPWYHKLLWVLKAGQEA